MIDLLPKSPLSQVVFVHDYIQLVFDDQCFSIYNPSELRLGSLSFAAGQAGFCDQLVGLINQAPIRVVTNGATSLSISFEKGAELLVSSEGGNGPEAWQTKTVTGQIIVAQNL